jgi:hypothetical protein
MKTLIMDSYTEVRRVRNVMSESVGHDVRKLAALFNERRSQVADRIVDPGTKAEQCNAGGAADPNVINLEPSSATQ